jgi:Fe2+ transport system protein FeoA
VVTGVDRLAAGLRERINAYGVVPGRRLEVVQRTAGVTIVRVGHVELAFEADLASGIRVAPVEA